MVALRHVFGMGSEQASAFERVAFSPIASIRGRWAPDEQVMMNEGIARANVLFGSQISEIETYWDDDSDAFNPHTHTSAHVLTFTQHSIHDLYEMWRTARAVVVSTPGGGLTSDELTSWLQHIQKLLDIEADITGPFRRDIAVSVAEIPRGHSKPLDREGVLGLARVVESSLALVLRHVQSHSFGPTRVRHDVLLLCLRAAKDDDDDNPHMGYKQDIRSVAKHANLPVQDARRAVCKLVEEGIAYFVEPEDSSSEPFLLEHDAAERQLYRWQTDHPMTTHTISVEVPAILPAEWRDLATGIAGKYGFTGKAHLAQDRLYMTLETLENGESTSDAANAVAEELEKALTAPSRIAGAVSQQTYINHGQVAAMGQGSSVRESRFQQQINHHHTELELRAMVGELAALLKDLTAKATAPEHFSSLALVSQAKLDAEAGNSAGVIAALKGAGKWVKEAAVELGAKVISELVQGG